MNKIRIEKAEKKFALSYRNCVEVVAKERKYLATTKGFTKEETEQLVDRVVKNNLSQYYALDRDMVVGWSDVFARRFEGLDHVGDLGMGLIERYRSRGFGTALMNKALEHAKQHNSIEKVELEVYESNKGALAFYQKHGFVIEGKKIKSRKIDGAYDNIILMGKEL